MKSCTGSAEDSNGWYLVVQGQYLTQRLILDRTGTSSTTAGKYHHLVKTREESDIVMIMSALWDKIPCQSDFRIKNKRCKLMNTSFMRESRTSSLNHWLYGEQKMIWLNLVILLEKNTCLNKSSQQKSIWTTTKTKNKFTQSTNEKFSSLSPHHSCPICCLLSGPMYTLEIKMKDENMRTTHQRQQHDTRSWCQYGLDRAS